MLESSQGSLTLGEGSGGMGKTFISARGTSQELPWEVTYTLSESVSLLLTTMDKEAEADDSVGRK